MRRFSRTLTRIHVNATAGRVRVTPRGPLTANGQSQFYQLYDREPEPIASFLGTTSLQP